tara:strand:+ start:73 stop:1107 length:1035 start_codon:yes stop_codon:yes gene_type:complete
VTSKLIRWYIKNKRDLPWRNTTDPYSIWVSEIILQQTQIKTGINYYNRFIEKFPNIKALAMSNEIDVLNLWQGLGYYNRALNMLIAAKTVMKEYHGVFPVKYDDLIQLKGVGEYTASAISSICSNENKAVVDGNVYRFLSRLYDIATPINTPKGKKEFQKLANKILPSINSGTYNQAIMEFGSIHCQKHIPKCHICPFQGECLSFNSGVVKLRPVKNKINRIKTRYLNYFIIRYKGQFIIQQRGSKDIWKKLYELPLIESKKEISKDQLIRHNYLKRLQIKEIKHISSVTHKLTHQNLKISFWETCLKKNRLRSNFFNITIDEIQQYPFPKPLKNYFDKEHISI